MFRYTLEELQKLKKSVDLLYELEQKKVEPLTEDLLRQLVNRVSMSIKHFPKYDVNKLFEEHSGYACGCLGPRDGESFCSCVMSSLQYAYRYDVALSLVSLGVVEAYDAEKWAKLQQIQNEHELTKRREQEERNAEAQRLIDIINSDGRVVKR